MTASYIVVLNQNMTVSGSQNDLNHFMHGQWNNLWEMNLK